VGFDLRENGKNVRERKDIDTTGWKFGDETPKLDSNFEVFLIDLEAGEQKTDTAITHDDFNASVVAAAQSTLKEQCNKYLVSDTPDTNADADADALKDDLEEQPNHIKLARIAFSLDYPPGLVGDVAKYLFNASRMPIKTFSIGAALIAIAHVSKNKFYVGRSRTGLNLYVVMIGDTGAGKECPRRGIKDLLKNSMCTESVDESMASGAAVLKALSQRTNCNSTLLSDEFGMLLQQGTSPKGSQHQKDFFKEILTMYSCSRSFWCGKTYADGKNSIPVVNHPFLNIMGTTTSEFIKGVTSDTIMNGTLNRFLFIEADSVAKVNRNQIWSIPSELVEALQILGSHQGDDVAMTYEAGAEDLLIHRVTILKKNPEYKDLWTRYEENVIKVAGLVSLPSSIITKSSVIWSLDFVKWSIDSMVANFEADLSESYFDAQAKKVLKLVKAARSYHEGKFNAYLSKGYMPKSKLLALMHIKVREIDEVLTYLLATGQLKQEEKDNIVLLTIG
jgi:hypothetical protein